MLSNSNYTNFEYFFAFYGKHSRKFVGYTIYISHVRILRIFFFRGSGFLYNYKLKFVVKEEGWAEVAERDNKYLYDGGRGENMQCTSCYE